MDSRRRLPEQQQGMMGTWKWVLLHNSGTKKWIKLSWEAIAFSLLFIHSPLAFAHGDLQDRIDALTVQLGKATNNAALYFKRGTLHCQHGDLERALADFASAEKFGGPLPALNLARGKAYFEAEKPEPAKAVLDRFLAEHATHSEALAMRARILARLGQPTPAVHDFSEAIRHTATPSPELFLERAEILAADNKVNEALQGLDEGIKRFGPLVVLQLPAIDFELQKKNYDAALVRLNSLIAQSPRKEAWLERRGQILEQARRIEEARKAYSDSLAALESLPSSRRYGKSIIDLETRLLTSVQRLEKAQIGTTDKTSSQNSK